MKIKMIFILTLAVLVLIFIIQNIAAVEIRFLFWKIAMSSSLLIFFSLAAGFAFGWVSSSYATLFRFKSR